MGRLLLASLRHLVDEKKSAILCDCLGSLIEYFHAMLTRWMNGTELSVLNFVKYNFSEVVVAIVYVAIGVLRLDKGRLDHILGPYR